MDYYLAIQETLQDAEYRAESIRLLALAMSYKYCVDYDNAVSAIVTLDASLIDFLLAYYGIEIAVEVTF